MMHKQPKIELQKSDITIEGKGTQRIGENELVFGGFQYEKYGKEKTGRRCTRRHVDEYPLEKCQLSEYFN